jgi:hypothetical protein
MNANIFRDSHPPSSLFKMEKHVKTSLPINAISKLNSILGHHHSPQNTILIVDDHSGRGISKFQPPYLQLWYIRSCRRKQRDFSLLASFSCPPAATGELIAGLVTKPPTTDEKPLAEPRATPTATASVLLASFFRAAAENSIKSATGNAAAGRRNAE